MNVKTTVIGGRRSARLASVAAVALLAGLLSGSGSAAKEGGAAVTLAYDCALPGGTGRVTVGVTTAFPASGTAGTPLESGPVTVDVRLPGADLAALLPAGTEAVASTATLFVEIRQKDRSAEARWLDLPAPGTEVPAEGEASLVHTGAVPSVTLPTAGDATFTAGRLTLRVRPVDDSAPRTGQETGPADIPSLTCEPAGGGRALLATVPVSGDTPVPWPSRTSGDDGADGAGGTDGAGADPGDGIAVEPRTAAAGNEEPCPVDPPTGAADWSEAPKPPAGAEVMEVDIPGGGTFGCAYAVGMATVHKLNGAMIINDPAKKPGLISVLANVHRGQRAANAEGGYYLRLDSLGNLKLPDADSTFLTFGFQPVSAKVEFENGPLTISTGNIGMGSGKTYFATASFKQSLRLHDVKVNGTPLDVGPECRTSKPFKVVLNGDFPKYVNVFGGGPMNGEVEIPPFSGCGTGGEDLDNLFTAAISGPGNVVAMNQGMTCVPSDSSTFCPPTMPTLPGREEPTG
ncbi:DUF6801 domain-containing protein [Streptomyces sp. NPDC052042]|uniref:DUF6801 domain-containing protein n=1 Tax=Streptomyces sp. NPDC052042 TaxID=3365683 RepID=UPI0037CDD2B8